MKSNCNSKLSFPVTLHITSGDGKEYLPVASIPDKEALYEAGLVQTIRRAMKFKKKIILCDKDDYIVFHHEDGKTVFDGQTVWNKELAIKEAIRRGVPQETIDYDLHKKKL